MRNQRLTILFIGFVSLLAGCTYDSVEKQSREAVPENFSQKILFETREAAWCQYSPLGDHLAASFKSQFDDGQYEFAVFHINDLMDYPEQRAIQDVILSNTFPCAQLNREFETPIHRQHWQSYIDQFKDEVVPANCGLAIDATSYNGNELEVKVKMGVNGSGLDENKRYYLTCYLIDKVMVGSGQGWDQRNDYNYDPSSPFYGMGDWIVGYEHPNVVVKVMTDITNRYGELIKESAIQPNTITTWKFTADVSQLDSDLRVVALVTITDDADLAKHTGLVNAQFVDVGQSQGFD